MNKTPNQLLGEYLKKYSNDPLRFVKFAYPWGEVGTPLENKSIEPWQAEILGNIRDGLISFQEAIRIAVRSGHGVGKSALVSWLIHWAISTCVDARGVVTANTDTQLRTKTWAELGKWHNIFIARKWFKFTATSIYSVDPNHEKTWRIDAIPWSENNTEAFAGMHNEGKRIIFIFDEASTISDKIWEVASGAMTDKNTQILWCVFGNPTVNTGKFHECFGSQRHRWVTKQVDSRTVSFTNKKEIENWIQDYGEDSDFIRIRVKGEEPVSSINQFIPSIYVDQATGKHLNEAQYSFAPVILTLDNAWTGGDEIVIGKRQGLWFSILKVLQRNDDDSVIATLLAQYEDGHKADAVFIDIGYGTGVYSAGKTMGRKWQLVAFGGESTDPECANKRTQMWKDAREWLKAGGAIPNDPVLIADLKAPESYVIMAGRNSGKTMLESKESMKKRGIASPNRGDALALSFAFPVRKRDELRESITVTQRNYDPFAILNTPTRKEYDPFAATR